jgi:hypothetical protein
MISPKPKGWFVLNMDDGVLRIEPTRHAAVQWLLDHACADRVMARHKYGVGRYEYTVGSGDPYDTCTEFIDHASVADEEGWDITQQPLYPIRDSPHEYVARPEKEAPQ